MEDLRDVGTVSGPVIVDLAEVQLKPCAGLMRSPSRGPMGAWTRAWHPAREQALPHHPDPLRPADAPRGRPGSPEGSAARLTGAGHPRTCLLEEDELSGDGFSLSGESGEVDAWADPSARVVTPIP